PRTRNGRCASGSRSKCAERRGRLLGFAGAAGDRFPKRSPAAPRETDALNMGGCMEPIQRIPLRSASVRGLWVLFVGAGLAAVLGFVFFLKAPRYPYQDLSVSGEDPRLTFVTP